MQVMGAKLRGSLDTRLEWMLRKAGGTTIADTRCVVHNSDYARR